MTTTSDTLNNPIWHALLTGNRRFASGTDQVKYYPASVSTFAGFADFSEEAFIQLYDLMPPGTVRATFCSWQKEVQLPWISIPGLAIYQLIDTGTEQGLLVGQQPTRLSIKDVPQMLELTRLTRPGPFNERTIDFGNYFGFFSGDMLVAMAGQRLQVNNYAEISAVCTHPHHQGLSYGRRLLLHQLHLIRNAGKTPMLHVKTDNTSAISLYESLGFKISRKLEVLIFKKE